MFDITICDMRSILPCGQGAAEAESHKSGALLLEGLDKDVEAMSRLWLPTRSKQKEVNPHQLV